MKQERGKLIQGCIVELVNNVSSWDSIYWGPSQEMCRRQSELLPKTQKRGACYHLCLSNIDHELSRVCECTGLAESHNPKD